MSKAPSLRPIREQLPQPMPLRHILGGPDTEGWFSRHRQSLIGGVGWGSAVAVIGVGGVVLWNLLVIDPIGNDPLLGTPPDRQTVLTTVGSTGPLDNSVDNPAATDPASEVADTGETTSIEPAAGVVDTNVTGSGTAPEPLAPSASPTQTAAAARSTAAPTTTAPTTTAPPRTTAPTTTAPPRTTAPTTTAPPRTTGPTTAAPTTAPPRTTAPTSAPATTAPRATTTAPPATTDGYDDGDNSGKGSSNSGSGSDGDDVDDSDSSGKGGGDAD